jgi:hypothetical protein
MNVRYQSGLDQLKRGAQTAQDRMARALTKAMRDTAKLVETNARAEIARGGLSRRWQKAFFARAKPRVGYSLEPTMRGYIRIGYANIFERGGQIRPKKNLLWVPLPTAPRLARKRITPSAYVQQIGPLHSINRPGKPPLLAGDAARKPTGRASVASLKTGARRRSAGRHTESVPIFVGIRAALIPDRLDVDRVYREAAEALPRFFRQRMSEAA